MGKGQVFTDTDDVFIFGKHKRRTFKHVMFIDPKYIKMMHRKGIIKLTDKLIKMLY